MISRKVKTSAMIGTLLLAVLLAASAGGVSSVAAQGGLSTLGKPEVMPGQRDGQVIVSWEAGAQAEYYVIAWLANADYNADIAAGRDWRESIVFRTFSNHGQTSHTVTRLDQDARYWFALGTSSGRFNRPQWSPWADLVKPSGDAAACAQDRNALVALYNSTDGPSWRNNVNWLSDSEPLGNWFGVSTDGNGCVVVLYLDNNGLSGRIPSELGNLAKLNTLDLDGNRLSGEIPAELGNLSNLTVLSLDHNKLSGAIPPELGQLSNLTDLELWNNELSGEIPDEIIGLTELRTLDLDRNKLTGTLPAALGSLENLGALWISRNQITGSIPPELGNLSRLYWLGLHSNELTGEIPAELG